MISMNILFILICLHFVADFICQSDWMASNKSSNWDALTLHVIVYSFIFYVYFALHSSFEFALVFSAITAVCHFITDAITSRITSGYFKKENYHNAFVIIGFDQVLHYFQLIVTYYILSIQMGS